MAAQQQAGQALEQAARQRLNPFNLVVAFIVVAATVASAYGTGFTPGALLERGGLDAAGRFVGGFFPPTLSLDFLGTTVDMALETVAMSVVGTVGAVLFGLPLAFWGMRHRGEERSRRGQGSMAWSLRWGLYYLARLVLNVLRGIPELIWALIFVAMVGLGAVPGILAIMAHATGVLGKLYAETLEAVDQPLVESARATGAGDLQVLGYTLLPASLPLLLSHTLYRWECNMRAAAILGFVGAGGIGNLLIIKLKLFHYHDLATLILATIGLVVLVDLVSQVVRGRVLEPRSHGLFLFRVR